MSRYIFTIKETYERTICVHADSAKAAYEALSNELERKPLSDLNVVAPEIKIAEPRYLKSRSIIDCTATDGADLAANSRFDFVAENDGKVSLAYFKYGTRADNVLLVGRCLRWGFVTSVADLTGTYAHILVYNRALTEQERKQYKLEYLGVESAENFYKIKLNRLRR